ncbi:uncharacterized protein LOC127256146 [Andrographis paniculata]|uniref:uncharacterized protein LOC127256146 n=1 Tax=Andrographis paniculata TaxID=175694 RepID=UPI0021E7C8C1|nr:uncharacterized protein LOC127256146 [Andrographis paniculata]
MECNKEEAMRAKSIAERKLLEQKDFSGAKKFALKAKTLYPDLDGISQILTTLDVYVAAENKINGVVDWYGVLGANQSENDETIRKHYRKLALALHPDKNKSVGADGAFKLISEAWSLLSDHGKRLAYDRRRSSIGLQMSSVPKTRKNGSNVCSVPTTPPSYRRTDTFWTLCHRCGMYFEYFRKYINYSLLCSNCHKSFMASETVPPSGVYKTMDQFPKQRPQNVPIPQKPEKSRGVSSFNPSTEAKAAQAVRVSQDKLKRVYVESYDYAGKEGFDERKKLDDKPGITRDLNMSEIRKLLIAKGRKEIIHTLSIPPSEMTRKASNKDRCSYSDPEASVMTVPDPDFYDFDQDRSEASFSDNEVWAAYDDNDGMPRFYALISKVISREPFRLKISWLNSKTNSEFSAMDWVRSGFYKTCGEFRVGRYESCRFMNAFSQKVHWSKGPRGSIVILPKKGDVWAVFKNWSSDWNKNTPNEVVRKYEMVIVLDDYIDKKGISIAPLAKVLGFNAIFRINSDREAIKRIPKEEMFRFSHRVPYYSITGNEARNAPKGCLELDPAALPLDLVQATDDVLVAM